MLGKVVLSSYQELVRQNWGFLSPEEQGHIQRSRVLLAGCGLGSNIAVLAARMGFCHFVVADGDTVEAHNLNRQAFRLEHVGQNKARATATLVREVNPEAQVEVLPVFLEADDAPAVVQRCNLLVNMVDPGPVLYALQRTAREQGKISFFPLNVGFGGVLLAFGPQSPSLEELLGGEVGPDLFVRIVERLMPFLPSYLWQFLWVAERVQRGGGCPSPARRGCLAHGCPGGPGDGAGDAGRLAPPGPQHHHAGHPAAPAGSLACGAAMRRSFGEVSKIPRAHGTSGHGWEQARGLCWGWEVDYGAS